MALVRKLGKADLFITMTAFAQLFLEMRAIWPRSEWAKATFPSPTNILAKVAVALWVMRDRNLPVVVPNQWEFLPDAVG